MQIPYNYRVGWHIWSGIELHSVLIVDVCGGWWIHSLNIVHTSSFVMFHQIQIQSLIWMVEFVIGYLTATQYMLHTVCGIGEPIVFGVNIIIPPLCHKHSDGDYNNSHQ